MSNRSMDWEQVALDFEPDGSLRDIYVFGTDLSDWQRVLNALRMWEPPPHLAIGGQPTIIPDNVEEIFAAARQHGALLSVKVSGLAVNSHFFGHDEIEFDFDPRDVTGATQLEGLEQFMGLLARATGKSVVMTMENMREGVILRFAPDSQRLDRVASG